MTHFIACLRFCTSILMLAATGLVLSVAHSKCSAELAASAVTTEEFAREVERTLAHENLYDYHKRLSTGPVHVARRNAESRAQVGDLVIPDEGWRLVWNQHSSPVIEGAVRDFQDYLETSMGVRVELDGRDSLGRVEELHQCVVVGTRDQMPGCGASLKGPKDYEIIATPERLTVCGYDERGAMYGLYNIEARMNLREGPFLPGDLKTVRHSLYDVRMVQSWMGWMEWPDSLLAHLAHDGFDAIFASCYANPNGDRTTAESSTEFYARLMFRVRRQDPARMHDLIQRASRYGIKVYAPIIYQSQMSSQTINFEALPIFPGEKRYRMGRELLDEVALHGDILRPEIDVVFPR